MATSSLSARKPKPRYQPKYLIGAAVILAVIGYLIVFGLTQTSQWALELSALKAKGASAIGQGVRVTGKLEPNSVRKDIRSNQIAFVLTDGTNRLPVTYNGVVPDTFEKAVEVVAEGKLNSDGTFTATAVLARCPSKYDESKLEWYDTKAGGNLNYGQ